MHKKTIGEAIAEARENKGLSQRQLAKIAEISNAELSKIESGEREFPNPKTLKKISNIIGVNFNDMLYMIGLEVDESPLNPFVKNIYSKKNFEQLIDSEINILSTTNESEELVNNYKEELNNENLSEQEKEELLKMIDKREYELRTSYEIIKLIQSLKLKERNKNAKKNR